MPYKVFTKGSGAALRFEVEKLEKQKSSRAYVTNTGGIYVCGQTPEEAKKLALNCARREIELLDKRRTWLVGATLGLIE